MIEDTDKELIHGKFDGELKADELERVDRLLAANAEARSYLASLQKLDDALQTVKPEKPAFNVQAAIMDELRPKPKSASRFQPVAMFAMAASLVLGVSIVFLPMSDQDIGNATGTLVSVDASHNERVAGPDLNAELATEWKAEQFVLYIDAASTSETTVILDFPERVFEIIHPQDVDLINGNAELAFNGDASLSVVFGLLPGDRQAEKDEVAEVTEDQRIVVTFVRDDTQIAESTLSVLKRENE